MSTDQTSAFPRAEQPRLAGEMLFYLDDGRVHRIEAFSDGRATAFLSELLELFDRHKLIACVDHFDNVTVSRIEPTDERMAMCRQLLEAVRLEDKLAERI